MADIPKRILQAFAKKAARTFLEDLIRTTTSTSEQATIQAFQSPGRYLWLINNHYEEYSLAWIDQTAHTYTHSYNKTLKQWETRRTR